MTDSFGYHGDGYEGRRDAPARSPSLHSDGDPFYHEPVSPASERHGEQEVYNPDKKSIDADELASKNDELTVPLTDQELDTLRHLEEGLDLQ